MVRTETVGAGVEVAALVEGAQVKQQSLNFPGAQLLWRTRGVAEATISGEGLISFIGFHVLDDARYWTHLAHRCLSVHDLAYPCGPQAFPTEEEEARSRLPQSVAPRYSRGRLE